APFPFLPVTVAPPLGLSISPASALAYVGAIVPVTLTGSAATGTAPQGPACLWPGNGRVFCDAGPGPTFPFSIAYGAPGSYEGKATLGDASQANVSLPFSAQVVER
ncbi:MAG: hypothetical protein L3J91_05180, partial [Thermoplasmata archaeon]|nr:hypothetical protein [Thermoplasmata archaeon]